MSTNSEINENIISALNTIKSFCDERHHDCKNCELANYKNECLVYEYPYLWKVTPITITKYLSD